MAPVVEAPTVPPAGESETLLSAFRVIKPEPESIELPVEMLLLPPVATKVTVPLPFAEIGWPIPTVIEFAAVIEMLPLDVVVMAPLRFSAPVPEVTLMPPLPVVIAHR